jgi:hypothetical protein
VTLDIIVTNVTLNHTVATLLKFVLEQGVKVLSELNSLMISSSGRVLYRIP